MIVVEVLSVAFAGLLAGTEFIVRWGVQPSLSRLEDRTSLAARKALIVQLRVLVPAIGGPALGLAVAAALLGQHEPGAVLRWAGVIALVAFFGIAFGGTVPINARIDGWSLEAPPDGWQDVIRRWQLIDVFRSTAAVVAFALLVVALALR